MQDNNQSSFAGKLFRLLPRPTRQCPEDIGYHDIRAYGELLYRSRLKLRTTSADLAAAIGCERWHTLPKVIQHLQQHGLIDAHLNPQPDKEGFFHRKKTPKRKWQDQLQTTTIYIRSPHSELTDIQNSILWLVHSFNSAGVKPPAKSVATLLRLDCRTVTKHLKWLQVHGCLDADLCVTADPRHWQDGVPKAGNAPEIRWETFAMEWIASRYTGQPSFAIAHTQFRQSLQEGCQQMAEAGYTSVQIRDYWEREVPEVCKGEMQLLLMDYVINRLFWRMFEAVEKATARNRQTGKFHGDNSLGLLRKVTASQVRILKTRLLERGAEGLELWTPDFSSLGIRTQRLGTGVSIHERSHNREDFERLLMTDAPELDHEVWLPRILGSPQFKDDPEQLLLDCSRALNDREAKREGNLDRLLHTNGNGKA